MFAQIKLALLLTVCLFAWACFDSDASQDSAAKISQVSNSSKDLTKQSPSNPWGIVPHWDNALKDPIHEPRAVYLNLYWIDLKPTAETKLTKESIIAAIELKLKRQLSADRPVAVRFVATGDSTAGPLPNWFEPSWKAPKECNTEDKQQLPAWKDSAQLTAHADIVRALAAALDGDPHIAWIEPGSYGFWGEGHVDGAPKSCEASIETRTALIRPWIESFQKTPLSVTMDWFRREDDPDHRLRDLWGKAANLGLRFDCLGFWHDQYAQVIEDMASAKVSWNGPWGGEFCFGDKGAQWATGSDKVTVEQLSEGMKGEDKKEFQATFKSLTGKATQNRVLGVVRDCHWSYLAGAGGSLLNKEARPIAELLEAAMKMDSKRDLMKCAQAARVVRPTVTP